MSSTPRSESKKSYEDKDIKFATLDFKSFKKIGGNAVVIVNSRAAQSGYEAIAKKLALKNKSEYISQRRGTKITWDKELNTAYLNGEIITGKQSE